MKIAQAGVGAWGSNLARNFSELAELRWIAETDESKHDHLAQRFPQARITLDFGELIADPDVDAVVVATPVPTREMNIEHQIAPHHSPLTYLIVHIFSTYSSSSS